ncbi:MAG: Lrp/AsnC family transcriptional regulator [Pseudomonadales bacterium]
MTRELIDRMDRRLLRILRDDGRITNTDLAEAAALSPSPCLRRIKRLESEGVIRGYSARLDLGKIGWGITAFVHINIEKHRKTDAEFFEKELANIARVVWCHALAGPWDLLLQVVARDFDDYYELVQILGGLEYVKDIQSTIVIGEIKADKGVPIEM